MLILATFVLLSKVEVNIMLYSLKIGESWTEGCNKLGEMLLWTSMASLGNQMFINTILMMLSFSILRKTIISFWRLILASRSSIMVYHNVMVKSLGPSVFKLSFLNIFWNILRDDLGIMFDQFHSFASQNCIFTF